MVRIAISDARSFWSVHQFVYLDPAPGKVIYRIKTVDDYWALRDEGFDQKVWFRSHEVPSAMPLWTGQEIRIVLGRVIGSVL